MQYQPRRLLQTGLRACANSTAMSTLYACRVGGNITTSVALDDDEVRTVCVLLCGISVRQSDKCIPCRMVTGLCRQVRSRPRTAHVGVVMSIIAPPALPPALSFGQQFDEPRPLTVSDSRGITHVTCSPLRRGLCCVLDPSGFSRQETHHTCHTLHTCSSKQH